MGAYVIPCREQEEKSFLWVEGVKKKGGELRGPTFLTAPKIDPRSWGASTLTGAKTSPDKTKGCRLRATLGGSAALSS